MMSPPAPARIPSSTPVSLLPDPNDNDTPSLKCACGVTDHFVQFYLNDSFLVRSVGRFVREGIASQAGAFVIATSAHRDGIARNLAEAGIDVTGLAASGQYVAVDAAEMLSRLMVDGVPDAERFQTHIGQLVGRLTAGGRPLCAFGEMVALLWADGKTEAAIQLEELWNSLGTRHVFSLFCAYPMSGFANSASGRPFLHVCQSHSRVLPPEEFDVTRLTENERNQALAILQQKAMALESEIAERKRVEVSLRRREAELTNFVETAALGLHWVDADGIVLWANQAELDLLGYTAAEYIGRPITDFHADPPVINDILVRLCRGEKLSNYEARLRCKDGAIKTVLIDSSVLWEEGRFIHTQCFTRDITEQRRAERASRRLAAIVTTSDDAIVSKTLDGIITSWNRGAEVIFGYTADEIIGRSIKELIPADRQDEETDILARLRRGERIDHFETIRRRKDGSLVELSVTISPLIDGAGKIIGASKIARDISERKKSERALAAAHAALAKANEELETRVQERTASLREAVAQMEEFSYTVSHDLRAPLRGMQVYSTALIEDYAEALDAQARHCLTRIAENASRLDKMVTDVLTFSRISRTELKLVPVDLNRLVHEIIRSYPAMQFPRAEIIVDELYPVKGHEPSLTQIMSNLVGNAVKFVSPGVTPKIRIWTDRTPEGVKLWVKDNGIGISPDRQSRLFRMFERVHPDLPYDGTGVGLAIVRKAANRMGGEVGVDSDGANGSAFWIQLPHVEPGS